MLFLNNISLVQFKNYSGMDFHFNKNVVAVCGDNGVGKTNLLDAIYYLSFTKSYFSRSDQQNMQYGSDGFRVEGKFSLNKQANLVTCILRGTGKKECLLNQLPYEKLAAHVGKFPCVMITPDDVQIITGGSEERRRFLDSLLSQLDARYLQHLIVYSKVLAQRNSLLRSIAMERHSGSDLLDVYDRQLSEAGTMIFEKRRELLSNFIPAIRDLYVEIAGRQEPLDILYSSQLFQTPLKDLFLQNRDKDLVAQRTLAGIHRDDIDIMLNGQPFRGGASQGQRKSLLFALKLAAFDRLKAEKGFAPLLLLDDVFEKLDEPRMYNLLQRVCSNKDGQIFISDTHGSRIASHFNELGLDFQLINLGSNDNPGRVPDGIQK